MLRRGNRSRISRRHRISRLGLIRLSLRLVHAHVINVHGRASAVRTLVIISELGRINKRLISPVVALGEIAAAHHLVELEHQAVLWVSKRVARTLHILHLHAVRHLPIEIEFDRVSSLQDTVGMELALRRGSVAVHHALMLLGLLGITDPGGVDIAHQETRVVTLGFEHVNFAVTRPAALGTSGPERGPGRTRGRKLDARLGVEASTRRGIQHLAIFCLGRDHARRERGIVHSAAVLARAWDLRAVPLGLRRGVPGRQVQIAILNRDVLRAIGVIHLRTLRRIKAAILIAPLRGIELVAVKLIVPRHLVATRDRCR